MLPLVSVLVSTFLSAEAHPADVPTAEVGLRLYQQYCGVCHQPSPFASLEGGNASQYAPLLSGAIVTGRETAVAQTIRNGGPARMPGFKYTLSTEEVQDIIAFLKTLDQPPKTLPGRSSVSP
jgi:mono/diheme cytochrome c family protein